MVLEEACPVLILLGLAKGVLLGLVVLLLALLLALILIASIVVIVFGVILTAGAFGTVAVVSVILGSLA
jgi:hypothetical protein